MSDELAMGLVELKRDVVLETVKEKAERGDDPLKILEECRRGMTIVGDRFQAGEFYLAEMMLAAEIFKGRKKAEQVDLLVVPGSQQVRAQAEAEGLDTIFKAPGAQWRYAGCSMCLGMNPDQLKAKQRCAATSNRNFEGRQGKGGRTHLVSPQMAAAAAIAGKFVDIRTWPP